MHYGIFFTMGITFRYQMTGLVFLSFFEPEKWFTNVRNKIASKDDGDAMPSANPDASSTILFDGVCNLCNGWVRFVMKNERKPEFRFASLQSKGAQEILNSFSVKNNLGSIVLIEDGMLYQKSEAVLRILGRLKPIWPLLAVFIIVPRVIRDGVYDIVAQNRYAWFGKQRSCELMDPADKLRFIES